MLRRRSEEESMAIANSKSCISLILNNRYITSDIYIKGNIFVKLLIIVVS